MVELEDLKRWAAEMDGLKMPTDSAEWCEWLQMDEESFSFLAASLTMSFRKAITLASGDPDVVASAVTGSLIGAMYIGASLERQFGIKTDLSDAD